MKSDIRSANAIVVRLVLALISLGIIDASQTLRELVPCTLP